MSVIFIAECGEELDGEANWTADWLTLSPAKNKGPDLLFLSSKANTCILIKKPSELVFTSLAVALRVCGSALSHVHNSLQYTDSYYISLKV